MIAIYVSLAITSLIAGLMTWARSRSAFVWLRVAFAVRLLYGFLQVYIAIGFSREPNSARSSAQNEFVSAAINILMVLALFLYFRVSSRVRDTFGRNI
jgi:hypothetical protein